jgi:hypothetical protein
MIAISGRKKTLAPLIVCFLAAFLLISRQFLFEPGPRYKGLPASYWRKAIRDSMQKGVGKGGSGVYRISRSPSSLRVRLQDVVGLTNAGVPAILCGDPRALDKAALEALLDIDREAAARFIFARGKNLWWKVSRDHGSGVIRAD